MNIQIDLNKINEGIISIDIPELDKVQKDIPTPATPVAVERKKTLSDLFEKTLVGPQDVRTLFKKIGRTYDNGIFTRELIKAKIVKQIGKTKRVTPSVKWDNTMGECGILSTDNAYDGTTVVRSYNINHPAIRKILNDIYFKTRKVKKG